MASEKATADKKVRRSGGLGNAFRGTVAELKKVQWPTKKQVIKYTGVVIVFCAVFAIAIGLVDALITFILGMLFEIGA